MPKNAASASMRSEFMGHPKGLFVLFFTEMWERFSYYGMRALLVLFLVAEITAQNPGFGWTEAAALSLYGTYTALVYISSIPGGIIADRWLGQKKAVILGVATCCWPHNSRCRGRMGILHRPCANYCRCWLFKTKHLNNGWGII